MLLLQENFSPLKIKYQERMASIQLIDALGHLACTLKYGMLYQYICPELEYELHKDRGRHFFF